MNRNQALPVLQKKILDTVAAVQFVTAEQLEYFCNDYQPNISRALRDMLDTKWLDAQINAKPRIYYLTLAGARMIGATLPAGKRYASWSVMAHACHFTEAVRMLEGKKGGFRPVTRLELLKQGFNPAFGEHAGIDAAGETVFLLLDDYLMGSDRIKHSWERRHTPNMKYFPDHTGARWCDVAHRYVLVTTDEGQADRHRRMIQKEALPADVDLIKPLWRL
jgi:hypothetical protein